MAYKVPSHRQEAVGEALEALLASRRAVLTTHLNADGDGAGSEVALATWLSARGNHVAIVNPTPFPDAYRFLLDEEKGGSWVLSAGSQEAQEACRNADLAVVLDTGEVPRIGRVKPMIDGLKTVVVDHHPPGDQTIGGIQLRDTGACATGELIYDVVLSGNGPWSRPVIEGIYVAVLTDTGSFRFSNAGPGSHRVAAELIERGADPEALYGRVYGASPLRRLLLLRAALDTLEVDSDAGVAWMTVPEDAYQRLEATADDLEGLVDYPRSVEGTQVGLLFRRTSTGTKVSFRASGDVDVNALARQFGGGGHVRASGALVEKGLDDVVPAVVEATRRAVASARAERA